MTLESKKLIINHSKHILKHLPYQDQTYIKIKQLNIQLINSTNHIIINCQDDQFNINLDSLT